MRVAIGKVYSKSYNLPNFFYTIFILEMRGCLKLGEWRFWGFSIVNPYRIYYRNPYQNPKIATPPTSDASMSLEYIFLTTSFLIFFEAHESFFFSSRNFNISKKIPKKEEILQKLCQNGAVGHFCCFQISNFEE